MSKLLTTVLLFGLVFGGSKLSIHIIVGKPRHGKTTFANILAREYVQLGLKRAPSQRRTVHANFPIHHPDIGQFNDYKELQLLSNAVAFVDEGSGWFGRRSYSKTTDDDLMFWRQHGHDDLTLFVLAHSIIDIETKIFELASTVWYVRRQFGPSLDEGPTRLEDLIGWRAKATNFDAASFTTAKRIKNRSMSFRIEKHLKEYDSFYVVGDRHGEGRRAGRPRPTQEGEGVGPLLSPAVYAASRTVGLGGGVVRVIPSPLALNSYKKAGVKNVG